MSGRDLGEKKEEMTQMAEGRMERFGKSSWYTVKKQTKARNTVTRLKCLSVTRLKAWLCYSSCVALGKQLWFTLLPAKA